MGILQEVPRCPQSFQMVILLMFPKYFQNLQMRIFAKFLSVTTTYQCFENGNIPIIYKLYVTNAPKTFLKLLNEYILKASKWEYFQSFQMGQHFQMKLSSMF